jgi:hypothetical protein
MAGTLALNVEILGEFKKLSAATQGAEGQLKGLNQVADNVSTGMNKAFGLIGAAFSVGAIVNGLKDASKAAIEDIKSQQLLAIAMENTGEATDDQIKLAEDNIRKMQFSAGVADDKLRPAFQKLFISTGDVTDASKLLQVALDTSASTGKDLDTVAQAMAKSLEGSDTALGKLVPSLVGAEDPLKKLEELFKGSAEEAANLDPYTQMQIIFEDLQEQVGTALLPILQDFSEWLTTPEGQAKLQEIVDGMVAIIEEGIKMVQWVDDNKDWLVPMVVAIGAVTTAWNTATTAVNTFKAAAGIATAVGVAGAASVTVLGTAGAGAAAGGFMQGQTLAQQSEIYAGSGFQQGGRLFGDAFQPAPVITNNISVKTDATAQEIANAINRANRASGTNLIRNAR